MTSSYAENKFKKIESLFVYFESKELDEQFKSHISKYLTVLIAGIYEDVIENFFEEYLQKNHVTNNVSNYVNTSIDKSFRNPNIENIKELLKKFSGDWKDKVKYIDEPNKQALDNIITNKNDIAHGNECNITY